MASLAWYPEPCMSRRSESPAVLERRSLFFSPRRLPHLGKLSKGAWTFEQRLMMSAFLAALVIGYVASTCLWQLVLGAPCAHTRVYTAFPTAGALHELRSVCMVILSWV